MNRVFHLLNSFGLLLMCLASFSHAGPVNLQLLARSKASAPSLTLDESDQQWLKNKGALVLGTSAPDYPPFDISAGSDYFEGLTADYAGLLSQLLSVEIKVRRYDSRAEVIAALKTKEIDVLGTANAYEMKDPQLAFSTAYANDTSVLVTRTTDSPPRHDPIGRQKIAMLYHYQPVERVKALYPEKELQLYASPLEAIAAVAFGQADMYLGDAISTQYLINKNYLNNVHLTGVSSLQGPAFSFAVLPPHPRLLRLINAALAVVPASERSAISSRWGANGIQFERRGRLLFSPTEQIWLEQHPQLKVAITEDFLPFTFFDSHGVFSGLTADLLAKISLRTGLKFELVRSHSVPQMIESVKQGNADLIAAFTPSSSREEAFRFTKPYLSTPFVLVTPRQPDGARTLDELSGKRVALVIDNTVGPYLTEHYPGVRLIAAKNSEQALAMLAAGEVEGAINSLISARYLIKQQHNGQLQISSTVGITPAQFSLAVAEPSPLLYSILGKALMSIPPEEMDVLTNRWNRAVVLDSRYWVRNRGTIIRITLIGALVLLMGIAWITNLRRLVHKRDNAERALSDQLAFMRALIDGTPHPIYVRDRDGRLLMCNAGYLNTFGVTRESVLGKTLLECTLASAQQNMANHTACMKVMEEGRPLIRDHQVFLLDGSVLTVYDWVLPYRGSDGSVLGVTGGWIDISERQQLLEQLQEAKNHADQASVAKSDFLTTMSHEIRTPMNAVIGMLELAMKKADQGIADSACIGVAWDAAHELLELIGDILDITQIESGRMPLNQQRTHLMKLVESTARVFEATAEQKGLLMSFELDPGINTDVLIDPVRFRQIVSNLLSNAIKFTDCGHVRLSVRGKGSRDGERLQVCVQVEDTGIGIGKEDQLRLFSPFSQVNPQSRPAAGSGLGLMISRRLCEMMGGTLTLQSTPGKGTCVMLNLDLVTSLSKAPPALSTEVLTRQPRVLTVLVVDDYPPNRRLLAQQLSYLGHTPIEAQEGAQALNAWRDQRIDMIMTDCAMPIMDGYELTRTIRAEEAANGSSAVLIVGFTANAQIGEVQRCLAAGMNDCLFKPISLQSLAARLASTDLTPTSVDGGGPGYIENTLIDLKALVQLTNGDVNALKHLLEPLISSLEDDMAALLKTFTRHDVPGMSAMAHKVKSGARMIKAKHLVLCCEQLEQACLAANWSQLAARTDDQYEAMAQVLEAIELYRM